MLCGGKPAWGPELCPIADPVRHAQVTAGAGVLTLAGVPIGQAEDAPARLAEALASADVIAAEDTRRVRQLAAALDVRLTGRVVSYYDVIEVRRAAELVTELQAGRDVLVVTDAGMPAHQRPRLPAGRRGGGGRDQGHRRPRPVRGDHGAGGLRPAHRPVLLRGVPAAQARGAGAAVRRARGRRRARTCSSSRRAGSRRPWRSCGRSHGDDRAAVVCRELTKTHEEIVRGSLAELAAWAAGPGGLRRRPR